MPLWTEDQFIARAKQLAREHASTHAPLNDLVEKVAREATLNPDEIRTLGRLTNVAVFQEMFQGKTASDAPDRMVEFEPGDPEVVITRIVKSAGTAAGCSCGTCATCGVKMAAYAGELPDLMRAVRVPGVEVETEKVASEPTEREAPRQLQIMRLIKLAENLDVETKIAASRWESTVSELVRRFKKAPGYGPSFIDFEKDALASEGYAVRPELEVVREELRLPPGNVDRQKMASLRDKHVYEDSAELRLIKRAVSERDNYVSLRDAKSDVQERLARLK